MNFQDWYTDRADIYRVREETEGAITRQRRVLVEQDIPCRLCRRYQSVRPRITVGMDAAYMESTGKLMCAIETDICKGDELTVARGTGLPGGESGETLRLLAGDVRDFHEPFGAVLPGLAHREVEISEKVRT